MLGPSSIAQSGHLSGYPSKYETEDGKSVALDSKRATLVYRPGHAPDVEPTPERIKAATEAVRSALAKSYREANAKSYTEEGIVEICEALARAVLESSPL